MGSIKTAAATPEQSHELKEEEFNYVVNINTAKQNVSAEYNRVMSAFLKYITVSRLGYEPEDNLQFELDFADEKRTLKITKLPPEEAA